VWGNCPPAPIRQSPALTATNRGIQQANPSQSADGIDDQDDDRLTGGLAIAAPKCYQKLAFDCL